jgi:GNAT superfamily N-acetyltransferase
VVTIRPVVASPHLATVAAWLHRAWWAADGYGLAATEAFLAAAAGPAAPVCFVAEADGAALGTATLDLDDLPSRTDLTPWLASVWVLPAARRRGIASRLVAHVERRATELGHARLHLFTPDAASFYAARGWAAIGTERWRGAPVTLMARPLRPSAG